MDAVIAFPRYTKDEAPPLEEGHLRLAIPPEVARVLTHEQLSELNLSLRGNRKERFSAHRRCRRLGISIIR